MTRASVTVPSDVGGTAIVLALVPPFAEASGVRADDLGRLRRVVDQLLRFSLDTAYAEQDPGEIEVTLEAGAGLVHIAVHDWGLPLTSAGGDLGPLPERLAGIADAQDVQLLNLGSHGKRVSADVAIDSVSPGEPVADAPPRGTASAQMPDTIEIRAATAKDAEAIAQLLYENYHLSYVHGDFYRPRYLMAAFDSGGLHSTIAVHEGRVIGHHALMASSGSTSAETGAAVVHSAYRGLGIFGRLFERTLEEARARGLAAVFGDAVTIHPFSQRAERSHGYRETALQLGMVPASTTMRGFGGDDPSLRRRTATLRSYRTFEAGSREVVLPSPYVDLLASIYANLGLSVEGAAGPGSGGERLVTTDVDEPRALGFVRVAGWGDDVPSELTRAVRHLLSRHVDVIYADLDLASLADPDSATAELNDLGFFVSGLLVHGADGHDHLRLQRLDSNEIELEEIVCDSSLARDLQRQVLDDMSRVGG